MAKSSRLGTFTAIVLCFLSRVSAENLASFDGIEKTIGEVADLRKVLSADSSNERRLQEEKNILGGSDPDCLLVFALAMSQTRPTELDAVLTRLVKRPPLERGSGKLRNRAAEIASFLQMPNAQKAPRLVLNDPSVPDSVRLWILVHLVRGSKKRELAFLEEIATRRDRDSKLIACGAKDLLTDVSRAATLACEDPDAVCKALQKAAVAGDGQCIFKLHFRPTEGVPFPREEEWPRYLSLYRSDVAQRLLNRAVSGEVRWVQLYNAAAFKTEEGEMVLKQEYGLWHVFAARIGNTLIPGQLKTTP